MRMCADPLKDVAQVFEGINAETFAGGGNACENRRCSAAVVTAKKCPVLSSDCNSTQAAFGAIVVDLQVAVVAVPDEHSEGKPAA